MVVWEQENGAIRGQPVSFVGDGVEFASFSYSSKLNLNAGAFAIGFADQLNAFVAKPQSQTIALTWNEDI